MKNKYYILFHNLPSMKKSIFKKILDFEDIKYLWEKGGYNDFLKLNIETNDINLILKDKKNINDLVLEKCNKENILCITIKDEIYPKLLKEINDPPQILYIKGKSLDLLNHFNIAVVGTRHPTGYGMNFTKNIIKNLVEKNICIVSGLALGIDSIAHRSAFENQGNTIAVLGSGICNIYPAQNINLAKKIIENNGLVISEFPIFSESFAYNFPIRNRIISGLSKGVVIVEAKEKSGSLITAKLALEQNRDVFALPGNVNFINSVGTNNLIKNGEAKLIISSNDILSEYKMENKIFNQKKFDNEIEEQIYNILSFGSINTSELCNKLDLSMSEINFLLTNLELKGYIKKGDMNYWEVIL